MGNENLLWRCHTGSRTGVTRGADCGGTAWQWCAVLAIGRRGRLRGMLALACPLAFALGGCSAQSPQPVDASESRVLSIEEARDCLVEWVRGGNNGVLKMSLPVLESAQPTPLESGWTAIGPWRVHLEARTFIVSVDAPPHFEEHGGAFRYDQGSWRAEVDYEVRN